MARHSSPVASQNSHTATVKELIEIVTLTSPGDNMMTTKRFPMLVCFINDDVGVENIATLKLPAFMSLKGKSCLSAVLTN